MFTNSKKMKKFILALVVLILFSFCYPKNVKANILDELAVGVAKLIWTGERGILKYLNNIFASDEFKTIEYKETETAPNGKTYETTNLDIVLTPENIIKGRFMLFDANIFKSIDPDASLYYDYDGKVLEGRTKLRETIAGWYFALRNFAIIALLSVLAYVGIRMITSTISQDKAKYKVMFKDWVVALCLLIVMHYIMIGILNITTIVLDALGSGENSNMLGTIIRDITGTLSEQAGDDGWVYQNPEGEEITVSDVFAKELVLVGIIGYTFIFAIKYLKREFTIIFLILLGPVSCITYPIDKISDGKSQAFNKWFSEFLYQVIIQPFHLLLYIVLVGSAAELAEANVIYALVCFAILIPSEKFIKEMFGFKDKLGSPLGAFASGAIASKALSSMFSGGKGGSSGGNKGNGTDDTRDLPVKTVDKKDLVEKGGDNAQIGEAKNQGAEGTNNQEGGTGQPEGEQDVKQGENQAIEEAAQTDAEPVDEGGSGSEQPTGETPATGEGSTPAAIGAGVAAAAAEEAADNSQNSGGETEADRGQETAEKNRKEGNKFTRALGATGRGIGRVWAEYNRRAAKKWGTTNMAKRVIKKVGKAAKFTLKSGGILSGAALGGAVGSMFGKGAAGAAAGMGIGSKISGTVIKGATGTAKTISSYGRAMIGESALEKKARKEFTGDATQIDKARLSYMKNNGGKTPGARALNQEINDRYELSKYGLEDAQIDRAVGSYQKLYSSGMSKEDALNQTVYAAKLAKDYEKKDFRSEKTMSEAVETISKQFVSLGASRGVADAAARDYLVQAAGISGTEIAIDMPVMSSSLGMSNASAEQIERINKVTVKLRNQGANYRQIQKMASSCSGGTATQVLDRYEATVEYLSGKTTADERLKKCEASVKYLSDETATKEVISQLRLDPSQLRLDPPDDSTKSKVQAELFERSILREFLEVGINVKDAGQREAKISEVRNQERSLRRESDVQRARRLAATKRGEFGNVANMTKARDELVKALKGEGVSHDQALTDAKKIFELASEYNGETLVDGVF